MLKKKISFEGKKSPELKKEFGLIKRIFIF